VLDLNEVVWLLSGHSRHCGMLVNKLVSVIETDNCTNCMSPTVNIAVIVLTWTYK